MMRGKFITKSPISKLENDPFQTVDQVGVGHWLRCPLPKAKAHARFEMRVCGEHGGDPDSIIFFDSVGLDYVSCSPYRVPIARLAAAQATIMHK